MGLKTSQRKHSSSPQVSGAACPKEAGEAGGINGIRKGWHKSWTTSCQGDVADIPITSLIQWPWATSQGWCGCLSHWLLLKQNGQLLVAPHPVFLPFAQPFSLQKALRILTKNGFLKWVLKTSCFCCFSLCNLEISPGKANKPEQICQILYVNKEK